MTEYWYNSSKITLHFMLASDSIQRIMFVNRLTPQALRQIPRIHPLIEAIDAQFDAYFRRELREFDLPYQLYGTPFQLAVWQALCEIPYGTTTSYASVATNIGNTHAARAVGSANHNNPIPIIVPCHRVIGANGKLTGYAGGIEIKEYLLKLENGMV